MFTSVLRSAIYYRNINVIAALAVAISTAVIGGAMIVGDSVRFSLRQMTRQRLGDLTHVVHGRFVREQLGAEVAAHSGARVAPAVMVTAGIERTTAPPPVSTNRVVSRLSGSEEEKEEVQHEEKIRRSGSVSVTAVGQTGWNFFDTAEVQIPEKNEIVLGHRTAGELSASIGETVSVWVELPTSIPRDSLLGEREDVSAEIQFTVKGILPATAGASRFSLNPAQQLPRNAFVSLPFLQRRLGIQTVRQGSRNSVAKPAMVNTLLIDAAAMDTAAAERLSQALKESLTLDDLALRLRVDAERSYLSAETDRMILEDPVTDSISFTASQLGLRTAPTLVYLINEFAAADRNDLNERYSMYSIVAGLPLEMSAPLGPIASGDLEINDIILSEWLRKDLDVQIGDRVSARWHEVGSHGELPEITRTFNVVHVIPGDDHVSVDPGLTPGIPGVTDVESFSEWDQPFEMENDRITGSDDDYWDEHKATPKAFVSLATAQELWQSRYGKATSIRIAADVHPLSPDRLQAIARQLTDRIPRQCNLSELGLLPMPVLESGLRAAAGANDFTQLFFGFSFFLILSAIILTSLMFRLGIQQRTGQAGVLGAVGLPPNRVRSFFLGEGLLVVLGGTILGALLAVGFAKLMVYGLTTWWIDAIGTRFLILDIQPTRLLTAAIVSLGVAGGVIWSAVAYLDRTSIQDLLTGMNAVPSAGLVQSKRINLLRTGCLLSAILLPAGAVAGVLPAGEAFSGLTWNMVAFFLGGAGGLTGGLLLLRQRLQTSASDDRARTIQSLSGFAMANAARNPWRSLMTTALIASATFLIVAVAAGRRNPLSETPDLGSGNGGFRLVAESSQPVLRDISTTDGRIAVNLEDAYTAAGLNNTTTVYPFAMRPGEDASCVNLYQTRLPTLLGASDKFIERGGFRFADTPGRKPWTLLKKPLEPSAGLPRYPVIGDMNTLRYSLKKNIGDVIPFPDEENTSAELQIVGMLDGSLLQGVLVMSRTGLQKLDSSVTGFQYFLAEADTSEQADALAGVLESTLNSWGMDTEPVGRRLENFLAVQNTYLLTFQLLGGLGLLVGVVGLAVVMIRNIVERRYEIAMLCAIGFAGSRISCLVLVENCVLLFWGIFLGTFSALLAMMPHLLSTGADLPWQSLGTTLAAVALTGMLSSVVSVRLAQQVSIRDNLSVET